MTAPTRTGPERAAPEQAAPARDGVLRLVGTGDVGCLDPVCVDDPGATQLARLSNRQLFGYRPDSDPRSWRSVTPVPDLAAVVPSIYNAGVGASGRSYVITLRRGVRWDTTPYREVTAQDVIRGLKRLGNPVRRPAALAYFTSTIRGMAEFCAGYAAAVAGAPPSPARLARYQNTHDIPGVFALDDETLVIELTHPAVDLVHLLALPCAAPAPVEYDDYLPGSTELRRAIRSTGPYRPVPVAPGRTGRWEPNPAWRPETDPVREAHLEGIECTVANGSAARLAELVRSGHADLVRGAGGAEGGAEPVDAPGHDPAYALSPFLVANLCGPGAGGSPAEPAVRNAIAAALDRPALARIAAAAEPGTYVRVASSVVPPGNDGYRPAPSLPGRGAAPDETRRLLASAGRSAGLTLTTVHGQGDVETRLAQACADQLRPVGITLRLRGLADEALRALLHDPAQARAGAWDLALLSRWPRWAPRNARDFLQPLTQHPLSPGNPGGYQDDDTDRLVEQALDATADPAAASNAWQAVERRLLDSAAVIPLLFRVPVRPRPASARVRGAVVMPTAGYTVDLCGVRLEESR